METAHKQLLTEINSEIDAAIMGGQELQASWIAHTIVSRYDGGLTDAPSAEIHRWATRTTVREMVRRAISKRAGDRSDNERPQQIELPGFDRTHLQDYYMVKRGDDEIGVPITQMLDVEIDAKADEHRKMGAANYEHADELERFKRWRADNPITTEAAE